MNLLEIIKMLLTVFALVYSGYFVVRFLVSLFYKKKEITQVKPQTSFAILIPARNEENTIGQLIESLMLMDYPKQLYDVYTIVNNSSDNTKEIAVNSGSKVIEATSVKCKADALRYSFNILQDKNYDYYVIFDADNLVDNQFLKEMNNYAVAGYKVAQGKRMGKNTADCWIAGCYEVYYMIQNTFFNIARMKTDNTCSINGTGWMVAKSLIEEKGFPTKTLTEDVEFSGLCTQAGIDIAYASKAVTYDEYPIDFKTSWIQRKRWSAGSVQCYKIYCLDCLKEFWKTGRQMCLDYALIYFVPILQIMSIVAFGLNWFNFGGYDSLLALVLSLMSSTVLNYLLTIGFVLFTIKVNGENVKKYVGAVMGFGLFMGSWVIINLLVCIKTPTKWEPIVHNRAISINQIK